MVLSGWNCASFQHVSEDCESQSQHMGEAVSGCSNKSESQGAFCCVLGVTLCCFSFRSVS